MVNLTLDTLRPSHRVMAPKLVCISAERMCVLHIPRKRRRNSWYRGLSWVDLASSMRELCLFLWLLLSLASIFSPKASFHPPLPRSSEPRLLPRRTMRSTCNLQMRSDPCHRRPMVRLRLGQSTRILFSSPPPHPNSSA